MSRQKRNGSRFGLTVAAAILGAAGAAHGQSGALWEALSGEYPGVAALERGGRVTAVFGVPMTAGETARAAMEDWLDLYSDLFGVEGLEWVVVYAAEIGRGRTAFTLRQSVTVSGGILTEPTAVPFEGGRLRVVVSPEGEGYAVTYVGARVKDPGEGAVAAPQITGAAAIAAAGEDERTEHLEFWDEPELVVYEADLGLGREVFVAWRLVGRTSAWAAHTTLIVHVDGVTGEVASAESGVMHGDAVTGSVQGKTTSGLGPPYTGTVTTASLPEATVCIVGEDCTTVGSGGTYSLETTSSPVDVKASLSNAYWATFEYSSPSAPVSLTQTGLTPPASGVNFFFNPSPSTQQDTAAVNVFVNVRKTNNFWASHVTSWQTILDNVLPPLTTAANSDEGNCFGCGGGFYDSGFSFIGLCLEHNDPGQVCANSGYSTWISHEYGHHIVHNIIDATSDHPFHEGYADSLSMLVHDTSGIGFDYHLDNNYAREPGAADIKYPGCGLPSAHVHGQILGRIWWDLRTNIDLATARQLFAYWTMMTSGQGADVCSPARGAPADTGTLIEVLTVDDDDNTLSNGTPNDLVICAAFNNRDINTQFTGTPCPPPLRGGGTCRADLNYDGALDIFDFLEFENMFAAGDMFVDFTGDGVLDFFDFLEFQNEVAAGCR